MMDNNYNRKRLWAGMLALHLLLPSFLQIFGLNITYLYPIFLLVWWFLLSKLKIKVVQSYQLGAALYWLYLFWVAINAVNSRGSLYGIVIAISTLGFAYLIITIINTKTKLEQFIDAILLITLICCLLGIVEAVTSINFFQLFASSEWTFFTDYRMGIKRVMVQFAQPIVYGLYLILVSPLAVYRMVKTDNRRIYRRTKIIYVLMCINIVLTVSRAPMFAFLLLQLMLWYMVGKRSFVFKTVIALAGVFVLLKLSSFWDAPFLRAIRKFLDMFLAIFETTESTEVYSGVANRLDLFGWVLKVVDKDIWFGKGLGATFEYEVYDWQIKQSIENEYLNTFFHMGIIGVVFEIFAFIGNVIYAFKAKVLKGFDLASAIGCTLLTYYLVIATCGESSAISTHIALIAILTVYNSLNRKEKD